MAHTITKTAFERLPTDEKVAIRAALAAVNAVPSARSVEAIESVAFRNSDLRGVGPDYFRELLTANAKAAGFDLSGPVGAEIEKRYDFIFRASASTMRELLGQLASGSPLHEKWFGELARLVEADAPPSWKIERAKGGHALIETRPRFKSALGLIAYVILRLSAISVEAPAVLQCEECRKFKLIESTGGDRISRFCSTRCRNAFTVRDWRARRRKAAARRPK